ncbi:ectonucleoside triphosphate diphosphohydrolase 3 isoform X2 [Callorhinchus milii]|uniref:Ectonucleoside triphosphate diphosphohydrolase 3-like n=1 Tax=Callorhinchus milii TaxID=7868 RepID=A0A4W3JZZ9_CALMI|nr:ectonucleoside triphosphate diphosphohydrolase 3 isoform X2 [Callorhinchus milii]|eukprot:gi/632960683/ref/XP_007896333.1/ PREDICTED: ectonucleoside triphosphate diphosphohydrolase 3-like isoform X2 [Callorhinchus milii]
MTPSPEYGIILDAGSSRTTAFVYQWPAEKKHNTGLVTEKYHCRIEGPGIATYKENPKQAAIAILDCLNRTLKIIPKERYSTTQVCLAATAGMRLLELQDKPAAQRILSEIEALFKTLPFNFGRVHILTGREEAIYAWISANYLKGNLVKRNNKQYRHPFIVRTSGALDLGGASTQIAFTPRRILNKLATPAKVMLYGHKYVIYTQSFECYGKDEAERRYLVNIYQASESKWPYQSPCWPSGYNETVSMKDLFGSLCTASKKPANYKPDDEITFTGTGNPAKCQELVYLLFDFKACAGKHYCSFSGIYQPTVRGKFMAFSAFYYTKRALKLPTSFTLTTFTETLWSFCTKSWAELKVMLPKDKDRYRKGYCFSGNYMRTLLISGYKFKPASWKRISFNKKVDGNEVNWSLGYMLNVTNQIPREIKGKENMIKLAILSKVLIVFSSLLMFSIFIIYQMIKHP